DRESGRRGVGLIPRSRALPSIGHVLAFPEHVAARGHEDLEILAVLVDVGLVLDVAVGQGHALDLLDLAAAGMGLDSLPCRLGDLIELDFLFLGVLVTLLGGALLPLLLSLPLGGLLALLLPLPLGGL